MESPAGNGAVGGPVPAKRRKTGGRKRGSANKLGKEARLFLAEHSNYLQTLCRLAQGRPIRLSRQRGHKPEWVRPSLNDMKWALEIIINRLIPTVAQAEIGGIEDGVPVAVTASEPDMREVARRLALIFTRGDPLAEAAEARGGQAVAPAAATAASALSHNGAQVPEGGGPEADGGPAEDEDVLPIPVEIDHAIDWGGRAMIRCQGTDDRTGLVSYALLDHVGRQIRYFSDGAPGFERAVELCEQKFGKPKCRYVRPPA